MYRPRAFSRHKRRRGAAAVELALLLPLLCFLFVATLDFCRIFYYSVTVSNCARNGAMYGSADHIRARDTNGIQAAAQADANFNLDPKLLSINCSTDSAARYVAVTVSYPFRTITQYPGIPAQIDLRRTVRMDVVPATPTFY